MMTPRTTWTEIDLAHRRSANGSARKSKDANLNSEIGLGKGSAIATSQAASLLDLEWSVENLPIKTTLSRRLLFSMFAIISFEIAIITVWIFG